jgi:hypothetical protein
MPILTTDIEFRLSGGAANANPALSLGGAKSSTVVSGATLFDVVSGAESATGDVEYRCIYVHNAHPTLTALGAVIWLQADSLAQLALALAPEGLNGVAATLANEGAAPSGVSWSEAADEGTALALGNIPPGQHFPVRIRRTVAAAAPAANAAWTLRVKCDTEA